MTHERHIPTVITIVYNFNFVYLQEDFGILDSSEEKIANHFRDFA